VAEPPFIPMPISDVAVWDDDARLERYPPDWPPPRDESKRYDPNQPRDPGGEDGGQWIPKGATAIGASEMGVENSGPFEVDDGVNFATTGYESGPGNIYYRGGVTIFVEDGYPDGEATVERLYELLQRTPEPLRRNVRSVNLLVGSNPHDAHGAEKFERPGFTASGSAYHVTGEINVWNKNLPGEGLMWHEMGHLMHKGGPADNSRWLDAQSLDIAPSKAALARIKAAEPDFNSTEFFTEGKIYGQETTTYISKSGTFILGDHAVTDYGRENIHEDYAESVELYMKDLKRGGLATVKEGDADGLSFLRRIYFEDIWPHRDEILREEIGL
jgi:hypothetical protein